MPTNDASIVEDLTTVAGVGGDDASLTGEPHGGSKKLKYKSDNEAKKTPKVMRFKEWIEFEKAKKCL